MTEEQKDAAAALYQVLGTLLHHTGTFDTDIGVRVLDTAQDLAEDRPLRHSPDGLLPFAMPTLYPPTSGQ